MSFSKESVKTILEKDKTSIQTTQNRIADEWWYAGLFLMTQQNSTDEDTNTDNIIEDEDLDTPFTLSEIKEQLCHKTTTKAPAPIN